MKKHVLYISIDGLTDPLGQAQILPYVCGLSNRGFRFTLVSAEKPSLFAAYRNRIEHICTEFGIDWKPVVYKNSPPIIGTIWMQKCIRKTATAAHKNRTFDLIHCRSYLAAQLGSNLSDQWNVPFLFDMRGLWADEKVEGGIWNLKKPLHHLFYRHFKAVEKSLFSKCSGFISLTHAALPEIEKISGSTVLNKPHEVIPCCTDTIHFSPLDLDESQVLSIRNELGIKEDTFVLTYLGSLSTWYLPNEMCALFKRLQLVKADALFLIITRESQKQIEEIAKALEIDMNYIRVVSANRQELPILLSLSSIAVSFVKPSYSKIASSPTKVGEYLSMGIPIISNAGIGDTDQLFNHPEAGSLCRQFTDDSYDSCIRNIIHVINAYPKSAIRELGKSKFDLNIGLERYQRIYKNLLDQK